MNAPSQLPRVTAAALLVLVLMVLTTGCVNPRTARLQPRGPSSDQPSSDSPGATPYAYPSVCGVPAAKR